MRSPTPILDCKNMKSTKKQYYTHPVFLPPVELLLEKDLLIGSVVEFIDAVETAGQKTDGNYTGSDHNTFNYDWLD